MLNKIFLVGRLTNKIVVEKNKDKDLPKECKKYAVISLAIPRSFKNSKGVYDTDFIDCYAFDSIAENTSEYCKQGDIIGVNGRVERGNVNHAVMLIAEKITFLSSKSPDEE